MSEASGYCGCLPQMMEYAHQGTCKKLGFVEGLRYPECDQYDEIVDEYTDCESGHATAGWCVPAAEEEEDGSDAKKARNWPRKKV